ncbi:DUF2235 domain-containing protein [Bradyrhizobium sp. 197]|uniref:DUF2235 domain-containing protein n=1 Tax=Bradyrhizobium sp. 197 TaxID=2782663 RepID=UPI001FF8D7D7|nr:DUF2235 domain-containing protein [Bradyrhizobium sp. 197]MCK1477246.1 DUF2235 domain-containing protein [Bradyrhizobium sp. 197]
MPHQDGAPNADSAGPEHAHIETHAGGTTTAIPPKRKLVLFADGTGNAFTTQESSVWRLYEALDHTQPDQIAYYIKGVGTAGWAPLAALDGATGIGVPGNVRKLYRFLCWNWREGDEIYIFGFSRGAFTARTLASLIASQGLVPAEIKGEPVSHAEMARNAMTAWRKYRRSSVPFYKTLPTIWIARIIRDVLLFVYHRLFFHRFYRTVRKAMAGRKNVKIEFLGLFDSVEAFGVPIEELRVAIDWSIWPISFRNHRPSRKAKHICHALALDDERTTFHPLRIDQSALAEGQTVKEVWFAGVHSDIGGGYPDSTLSFVPLVWMAEQLGGQLRFQKDTIERFREYQSAIGPKHDSRSGAAVLYRYGPRPILEGDANGGKPVVHFAVVERMLFGCDDYAPIMLPANARVLMPDGSIRELTNGSAHQAMHDAYVKKAKGPISKEESDAFTGMNAPDANMANLARGAVWWRRVAYFSLLIMTGIIAAWPWIAHKIIDTSGKSLRAYVSNIDWGFSAVLGTFANLLKSLLSSYAAPWLNIALYYPVATSLVVLATWWVWHINSSLRDGIQERARLAWYRPERKASAKNLSRMSLLFKFGGFMQRQAWWMSFPFTKIIFPIASIAAIYAAVVLLASSSFFTWRVATGQVCETPETKAAEAKKKGANISTDIPPAKPVGDSALPATELFNVNQFCWASRLTVEKGRKYRVWIDIDQRWFDRTIMTGVNGFQTYENHHYLALPTRRLPGADWFQPVVRVGEKGLNDQPLLAVNAMSADELPRRIDPTLPEENARDEPKNRYPVRIENTEESGTVDATKLTKLKADIATIGTFDALPPDETARKLWDTQKLADRMVAEFIAPDSGELFFYVNDAVQIYPGFLRWLVPAKDADYFGPDEQYYKNNSGTARITVQRLPAPSTPSAAAKN